VSTITGIGHGMDDQVAGRSIFGRCKVYGRKTRVAGCEGRLGFWVGAGDHKAEERQVLAARWKFLQLS
jgi:hypothetical protein